MGGPFSAQSADLRSIWGGKQRTNLMRRLGNLSFIPRGHPLWTTPRGNVLSLAQFRDNVLVGAKGPTARHEMQHVCHTLTEVWSLPVLCDCMTEEQQVRTATCMTHTMTAMGITTHVHGQTSATSLRTTLRPHVTVAPQVYGHITVTHGASTQTYI